MPEPMDPELAGTLVSAVISTRTAISIADATDPALPLIYVNEAFEDLTGYRSADVLGRGGSYLHGPRTDSDMAADMVSRTLRGEFTRGRLVSYRADGTQFWVDLHLSPVPDASGSVTRVVGVHIDATADVLAQDEAVQAATRDPLTMLMNRASFGVQVEREMARARRAGTSVGVLFLDLDDFKLVNDTYGHAVGDGYLVHVAECLRQRLRGQDAAARVGGDEFVVLLAGLPADGAEGVEQVVADLEAVLTQPFTVDGVEHRTTVSIGTAMYPRDGATVRELLAWADDDMYAHKPARGGRRGRAQADG